MIRHLGPSRDQRFDKLPELICEWVEQRAEADVEKLCRFLERVAAILRSYGVIIEYARENKPDADDFAATKRAMRVAMICAFEKVERK